MSESLAQNGLSISPATRLRALRLARRFVSDADEAEDVVQEALIRAWRSQHTLRDRDRSWSWFAQIVRNEALRSATRRRPEPVAGLDSEMGAEDDRLQSLLVRVDVGRGLGALDPTDQLLLRLRYELDLTQAKIADCLDWPEGTVKVRLHRARARLKEALVGTP